MCPVAAIPLQSLLTRGPGQGFIFSFQGYREPTMHSTGTPTGPVIKNLLSWAFKQIISLLINLLIAIY